MASNPSQSPIFSGNVRHSLDHKNRITIPARWRKSECDEFFIIPDKSNEFLVAMPPDEFQTISEKVANHPDVSARDHRVFTRQFFSQAHRVTTDKQGRLLL